MSKEQLTIEEKNILIAVYNGAKAVICPNETKEFEGIGHRLIRSGDYNESDYVSAMPTHQSELRYHLEYNWLMPVVKKVMDELTDKHPQDLLRIGIEKALANCYMGITALYNITVEAIQYLNQIAAINQ